MIAILAIGFLIGTSAVLGEDSCGKTQQVVAKHLDKSQTEDSSLISPSKFETETTFEYLRCGKKFYDETVLVVKLDKNKIPEITVDGTTYALDQLLISSVNKETAELKIAFIEITETHFPSTVNIVVPIELTKDSSHPNRNPSLSNDLWMLSQLKKTESYKVNPASWILPVLRTKAVRLHPSTKHLKYFMTVCQIVPSSAVEGFFKCDN